MLYFLQNSSPTRASSSNEGATSFVDLKRRFEEIKRRQAAAAANQQ